MSTNPTENKTAGNSAIQDLSNLMVKLSEVINEAEPILAKEIIQLSRRLVHPNGKYPRARTLRDILKITGEGGRIVHSIGKMDKPRSYLRILANLTNKIYSVAFSFLTSPTAEETKKRAIIKEIARSLRYKMSADDYGNILEYINHDEWGLALETVCAVIRDKKIPLPKKQYAKIIIIGKAMGMSNQIRNILNDYVILR